MQRVLAGLFVALASAASPALAQPTGACCSYIDGHCEVATQEYCENGIFGLYMGDGTVCEDVVCPPIGACCDPLDGRCVLTTTETLCSFYWERTWLGEGTSCEGENPCPQPARGACCLPSGVCEPEQSEYECENLGGVYQGDYTLCEPNPCPQPLFGACCFFTGGCLEIDDWLCEDNGGTFLGDGAICWPNPCDDGGGPGIGWSDNFDSYELGIALFDIGGWSGWDHNPAAAGVVSDAQARSVPHSIAVSDTSDAVHPFSGIEGGQWVITAWQYIPSDLSSTTYFVVNSYYEHGGPYYWTVELHFDPSTGMVFDYLRDAEATSPLPIAYDQWAEIRLEIDLDNWLGWVTEYYNGQLLYEGDWIVGAVGQLAIGNIDLFAPHSTVVYYDDLSLEPDSGPEPSEPVRPLFVGVQYGDLPTRTTDLAGFPDVQWHNGFVFGLNGAAGRPDGTLYLSSGDFNTELYLSSLEGPSVYLTDLQYDVSGLAYGRGKLWGFCNYGSPMGIYEINPDDGSMTLAVDTSAQGYRFFALDYNPADGLLYGYDEYGSPSGLRAIDVETGTISFVAPSVPADNSAARGLACGYNKVYAVTVYGADYPMFVYDLAQGPGGTWTPMTHPFPESNSTSGAAWIPGPVPGDVNCDGAINAFDIDPFVLALTDPDGYAAAYLDCTLYNADVNLDGEVNAFDIDPFVELLTGN